MKWPFTKQCSGCKQWSYNVVYRQYNLKRVGKVTSMGKLCNKCYLGIKHAVQHQLEGNPDAPIPDGDNYATLKVVEDIKPTKTNGRKRK